MQALIASFPSPLSLRPSLLQQLDARVKLLLLVATTVAIVTTPIAFWPAFVVYASMLAAAVLIGSLPIKALVARLAIVLPFILGAAIFLPFHTPLPAASGSAQAGWMLFLNFTVKSLLGATATLILTASTPFPRLLAALEGLKVPRVAVMIFSFTYRYLFVLGEEAMRMKRACDSRCYRGRWISDAVVIGRMTGTLFLRSYERGERVYLAMLSRGFDGTAAPPQNRAGLTGSDLAALIGVLLLLAGTWTAARIG